MEAFLGESERNTTSASDWTEVYEAVRWVQLVMASLSILGSGSIILCLMLQRLSRTPELKPLFLLSVSDLLLASCWVAGVVLFSQRCASRRVHCYNLHLVEQVFYMASFFYTLNYVWNLYKGLREKLYSCLSDCSVQFSNRVNSQGKLLAVLSCLLPALLMAPVFIWGNISRCHSNFSQPYRCLLMHTGPLYIPSNERPLIPACSLLHIYQTGVFLFSVTVTLIIITILVVKSRRTFRRVVASQGYLGNQQRASFRLLDKRMILYPLVFIVCWSPAVILSLLKVFQLSTGHVALRISLYVLQALTSGSQGFLNSLVYGWTRVQLRRSGPGLRDADTQTPLLRAQKSPGGYRTLQGVC